MFKGVKIHTFSVDAMSPSGHEDDMTSKMLALLLLFTLLDIFSLARISQKPQANIMDNDQFIKKIFNLQKSCTIIIK